MCSSPPWATKRRTMNAESNVASIDIVKFVEVPQNCCKINVQNLHQTA